MPEIGEHITFKPAAFMAEACRPDQRNNDRWEIPRMVTGRVCYINHQHRWYNVEYQIHGRKLYEGFKF